MSLVSESTHAVDCGEESIDQEFWMSAPGDLTEGGIRGARFILRSVLWRPASGIVVGEIPHVSSAVKADVPMGFSFVCGGKPWLSCRAGQRVLIEGPDGNSGRSS